ncbi:MAG TPA: GTPase HflX, partial [Terriglobales bacterium]
MFLVGVEFRRRRAGGSVTGTAQLARAAASLRREREAETGQRDQLRSQEFTVEDSMAEFRELATSAGAVVVGEMIQRRDKPDPATLVGKGKLEEITAAAGQSHADLVLFDHDLTPSQLRNIERVTEALVVDRTQLILDIFARHARTREGQLQVELAQLEYALPRLTGRGAAMSQTGGGIGTRGPGETQLETDRRKIARRMRLLKEQLEDVRRVRSQQRRRRESVPVPTVALVGYTNAGKSTLFNRLTDAGVLASSRMFATLDPTMRSITLPSKRPAVLSDTVGFIRNLPHSLVTSFRATLEEVQRATLILHVADATSTYRDEQQQQVERVLAELEVLNKPQLLVLNKIDLLSEAERGTLPNGSAVQVSAKDGLGIDALLTRIDDLLVEDPVRRCLVRIPASDGRAVARLEAKGKIIEREYADQGDAVLLVEAPASILREMSDYILP